MKKVLFIDRDGTLIKESPPTYQVDSFLKLEFYPGVFTWLGRIARDLDFELVMVTNQDGLGSKKFKEAEFRPVHDFIIKCLFNERIEFSKVFIDKTYPADKADTRKPKTGMLKDYLEEAKYDLGNSFVIGDRITDVMFAKNIGCRAIWLNNDPELGNEEVRMTNDESGSTKYELRSTEEELQSTNYEVRNTVALETTSWKNIYEFLKLGSRKIQQQRNTHETEISIEFDLDGMGKSEINTGLQFLNHMLEQLSRHSGIDLSIQVKGDLQIDEHHTIEDTAIALGEAFLKALGDKRGIERYGFLLPMDDCLALVAIDLGGRPWLVWDVEFKRERIGDVPTEMFFHFFKSFSDAARCNLNIKAEGENEHHKIESIFKALARSIKMAVKQDVDNMQLPSTKGVL